MAKITQRQIVLDIYNITKGKLEFISGKWFYDKNEIKDIRKYFLCSFAINSINELDGVIDMYKIMYGTIGVWPEMPIIKKARYLMKFNTLCYPLNEKQLKIINYLLRHD